MAKTTMAGLLLLAAGALIGCDSTGEGGAAGAPDAGAASCVGALCLAGRVADGVSGDVIVYWSDGDVGFKFGDGTASGGTFEAVVPAGAMAAFETRGVLLVGYAVVVPDGTGTSIADGSEPDVEALGPLGISALDAAIWRAADLSALRPDGWYQTAFVPGFACGRCVPSPTVMCSVDADCPDAVECFDGVCSSTTFDAYTPLDCSSLELVSDFGTVCNWT
jgi:hypothetical protein